jgi:hypothetical protein
MLDTRVREAGAQIVELFHFHRPEQSFSRLISPLIEDSQLASNFRNELARVIPPSGLFPKVVPIDYDPRECNIQRLSRSRQANNTIISALDFRGLSRARRDKVSASRHAFNGGISV